MVNGTTWSCRDERTCCRSVPPTQMNSLFWRNSLAKAQCASCAIRTTAPISAPWKMPCGRSDAAWCSAIARFRDSRHHGHSMALLHCLLEACSSRHAGRACNGHVCVANAVLRVLTTANPVSLPSMPDTAPTCIRPSHAIAGRSAQQSPDFGIPGAESQPPAVTFPGPAATAGTGPSAVGRERYRGASCDRSPCRAGHPSPRHSPAATT